MLRRFALCAAWMLATHGCADKDVVEEPSTLASMSFSGGWPRPGFSELDADQNLRFPHTLASDVSVSAPLPATFPAHPARCDALHFLRIRHADGPQDPSYADRILIAQPGGLEGASAFYNVAANLVTRAHDERGKYVEFWTIDRRANCLEDLNGFRLARETGEPRDLVDYYYRGLDYHGELFAGFLDSYSDAAWLAEMGMEQTVRDWHEVITRGIPRQETRQRKVFLGGHSLGGIIAGYYATWDFDGNPRTRRDAGYMQCAGFFGLDSLISAEGLLNGSDGSLPSELLRELLASIPADAVGALRSGDFPRFADIPGVLDPQAQYLFGGAGHLARTRPQDETDLVDYIPDTASIDRSAQGHIRYTNQALLGSFIDDNTAQLAFFRASAGFFTGGPVVESGIPREISDVLEQVPLINVLIETIGGKNLVTAADAGTTQMPGPLYGWLNYNEIDPSLIPKNSAGEPYTTPASEVTDMVDLARSVDALPMNFVEIYFPIRLLLETLLGSQGAVHTRALAKMPVLTIKAGDSPGLAGDRLPPGTPLLPGYDHLDVLTAAPVQNNGEPEPVTTQLLDFLF